MNGGTNLGRLRGISECAQSGCNAPMVVLVGATLPRLRRRPTMLILLLLTLQTSPWVHKITPLETNGTLENPHFQYEIHLERSFQTPKKTFHQSEKRRGYCWEKISPPLEVFSEISP